MVLCAASIDLTKAFDAVSCDRCKELITELLSADDYTLLDNFEESLQHIVICFSDAAMNFSLSISLNKSRVL